MEKGEQKGNRLFSLLNLCEMSKLCEYRNKILAWVTNITNGLILWNGSDLSYMFKLFKLIYWED